MYDLADLIRHWRMAVDCHGRVRNGHDKRAWARRIEALRAEICNEFARS